ncbi:MAG: argininosuccinate lyase [Planctomycetes bacterium]|nr:argininosuccinate lyase [Planctomycetota bacterium]
MGGPGRGAQGHGGLRPPGGGLPARGRRVVRLWDGRFDRPTHEALEAINRSLPFDRRLAAEEVRLSIAHARMLGRQGIIPERDAARIVRGLEALAREVAAGALSADLPDEDVHTLVERLLTERIGPAGGRLHTARSRNDQVVADLRLHLLGLTRGLRALVADHARALLEVAEAHPGAVLPAYTHMQPAQPVLLAHHLLAYVEMAARDDGRLADCARRMDESPLGSGACAGVSFPVDRRAVAREAGFSRLSANSMDAVASRDFACEFVSACAIAAAHLSRLAEDLVLWSTPAFGFVGLSDAVSTGSSIMPQKKNPDGPELVRAKAARLAGRLAGLLGVLKGLPLSYNKDLQEDKEAVFDAGDSLGASLRVMAATLRGLEVREARMRAACEAGYLEATDAADWLARRGVPFREAHRAVGRLVRRAEAEGLPLARMPLEAFREAHPLFDRGVYRALGLEACLRSKDVPGGTAPRRVRAALRVARRRWGTGT